MSGPSALSRVVIFAVLGREPGAALYLLTNSAGEPLAGNISQLPAGVLDRVGPALDLPPDAVAPHPHEVVAVLERVVGDLEATPPGGAQARGRLGPLQVVADREECQRQVQLRREGREAVHRHVVDQRALGPRGLGQAVDLSPTLWSSPQADDDAGENALPAQVAEGLLFDQRARLRWVDSAAAGDGEITEALRAQAAELESLRNRCARLGEAQADADLERFADVITNRDVVRTQLLANRDATLAVLGALRMPAVSEPLHQPRQHRPNLALLSPLPPEPETAAARRVANRARQLQSQLKIGHHAAFRLAEGEAGETPAA